jgi:hypothetical protein
MIAYPYGFSHPPRQLKAPLPTSTSSVVNARLGLQRSSYS